MGEMFFKVYKRPGDHANWKKQIEYAQLEAEHADLSDAWVLALKFLEQELGKGFLKACKRQHPIQWKISNKARWQVQELIEFAGTLKALKHRNCNYLKLQSKLAEHEGCSREAIPFIDVVRPYLLLGFEVTFLDEKQRVKTPDMELVDPFTKDKFFIEVSKLEESAERDNTWWNFDMLLRPLQYELPYLPCYCKQLQLIPQDVVSDLINNIRRVKKHVIEKGELVIYEDKWIILGIAPTSKRSELEEWAKPHRRSGHQIVDSLPMNFDDTSRVLNKIKEKESQISTHGDGLIYIPVSPLYFISVSIADIVKRIEKDITRYKNLLGVVLYSYMGEEREEMLLEENRHLYGEKLINECTSRRLLFINNSSYNVGLAQITLDKIRKTFVL